MNLSKSKYCSGIQCKKMLWLDKNYPDLKGEVDIQSVLDNGTEVGEVAKNLFKNRIDIKYNDNLMEMVDDTKALLNMKNIVITEASFIYDDNFCSVDILKKDGDYLDLYEVKSSTKLKEVFIDDVAYQTYILLNLGFKVRSSNVVYLNSNYERMGDLDLNELFVIEDVTDEVLKKQVYVKDKIKELKECLDNGLEPNIDIDKHCFDPYKCPFFKYCTNYLPDKNVFSIPVMRTSTKLKLYKNGIFKYQDLLNEDINPKYKEQIEFELYDKEDKIDIKNIKKIMDTLSYPIYFLDFETFQQSIPGFDYVRPYMQIPFQYSLHYIEGENGPLKHKEFLAEADIDPRRSLAQSLVNDIPENVCVLAYNMGFEKSVIKNLAKMYPDLEKHLMNIYGNIKDLMVPFRNRDYYTKNMQGSYSIKYVLPALFLDEEGLNYKNLDGVHNGSEAMNAYANMGNLNEEEQKELRKNLLKYCHLDTYAMVKIWEKLNDITKKN